MSIIIFANGHLTSGSWLDKYLKVSTKKVAADGGLKHMVALNLKPDVIIGDLDSVDEALLTKFRESGVTVLEHAPDKDETDLELALLHSKNFPEEEIFVFGGMGGRWDQSIANVLLLTHPDLKDQKIAFVDEGTRLWLINGSTSIYGSRGDLISLIPIAAPVRVAFTEGLRWPLKNEVLMPGRTRGVSNEMTGPRAQIGLSEGHLLCFHSRTTEDQERQTVVPKLDQQ